MLQRCNDSYYRYEASFRIWSKNKTEEIKRVSCDTNILYNRLHFWNKKRLLRKYKKMMEDEIADKGQVVMCELLQDDLVLIPKFTYTYND